MQHYQQHSPRSIKLFELAIKGKISPAELMERLLELDDDTLEASLLDNLKTHNNNAKK